MNNPKRSNSRENAPMHSSLRRSGKSYATTAAGGDKKSAPKHANTRTLYVYLNLVGQWVDVQVADGSWYCGLFHSSMTVGGGGLVLKYAAKKPGEAEPVPITTRPTETLRINAQDVVQIAAKRVTFIEDIQEAGGASVEGFMTDSAISRAGDIKQRELQRWIPDSSVPEMDLENSMSSSDDWDQFKANEELYGVRTTFDEELYTTKLDKNQPDFERKRRQAQRIADEIMRESSSNVHLAEERGHIVDIDEEEKYASARNPGLRSGDSSRVYVPPNRRTKAPSPSPSPPPSATPPTKAKEETAPQTEKEKPASSAPQDTAKEEKEEKKPEEPKPAAKPKSKLSASAKAFVPSFRPSAAAPPKPLDLSKPISEVYSSGYTRYKANAADPSAVEPLWPGERHSYHSMAEEEFGYVGSSPMSPMVGYVPYNQMGVPQPVMVGYSPNQQYAYSQAPNMYGQYVPAQYVSPKQYYAVASQNMKAMPPGYGYPDNSMPYP